MPKQEDDLYAVMLLFQFRVKELPGVNRTCEKRIIHVRASSDRDALRKAEKYGKTRKLRYKNSDGNTVLFEFVGVIDIIKLSHVEPGDPEVWYDIVTMKQPMERRDKLVVKFDKQGWSKRQMR